MLEGARVEVRGSQAGIPVASPRFHGVPRRDVACRVHVCVAGELAGYATEEGLALAALPCDVPARRAALVVYAGGTFSTLPGAFSSRRRTSIPQPEDWIALFSPAFCATFLPGPLAALRGTGHAGDAEVLNAYHVKAPREAGTELLAPVLTLVGLAGLQPRDRRLAPAAVRRTALRLCEFPLQRPESPGLSRGQTGAAQHLPGGQRSRHRHAPIYPYHLAHARTRYRSGTGRTPHATDRRGHGSPGTTSRPPERPATSGTAPSPPWGP